jgi:Uma2 family endonuclease
MPNPVGSLVDLPPIRMPVSAGTLQGFRDWVRSPQFPKYVQPTYAAGTIYLSLGPEQLMLCLPASATTLDGFRAWATSEDFPQRGRISFLGQELFIDMSPEELETHNKVKTAVCSRLAMLNADLDLGEFYSDRTLVVNDAADLSTEPDGVFVLYKTSEAGQVPFVPRRDEEGQLIELHGTPDWVLEVVSRHSFHDDTVRMRELYHRAGISEYWLIDAMAEDIRFQILTWRRSGYVAVRLRGGWHKSRVFPASFRLERERNRAGRWKYQLLLQLA